MLLNLETFQWRISRVVDPSASMSKEKAFSIAAALPVPPYSALVNVKTWFQNRRMKLKQEVQDLRPALPCVALRCPALPPLLFQHPPLSGQLPTDGGFYWQLQPLHRASLAAAVHPALLHPRFY
ncbi:homeobox protein vent1-like [Solea senegalensis]|uniref:Homeobox protein vent1-like n=1 Tax=Solea senegalensis TaxID=28829 RepID=A0AAV6SVH1_SOLSE|nr:homeobox protein vent1-like [Solea senegalensis]